MKQSLIIILAVIAVILGSIYVYQNHEPDLNIGAALPVAGSNYTLAGSGVSSSATSFTLTSFTIPQSGAKINDSQISDTFYLTIEPGNKSRQEIVSCTTVVQNSDGTATISGCTRGLSPMTPFTSSSTLQFAHAGGSLVIISNPPQLYEQVGFLSNDEAITGNWTAPTPTGTSSIATRGYVLNNVTTGNVTTDVLSMSATAGETFATGTIVYYDATQTQWMKADADIAASSTNVHLGIAQGAGTDGTAISGGVLTRGYDRTQTGMTQGNLIYLSNTAGATSTSAGTISVILGRANAADKLYFDPAQMNMVYLDGNNNLTGSTTGATHVDKVTFSADGTWTKDTGLRYIIVEAWGGGGGGGGANTATNNAAGGGGGAYVKRTIQAGDLGATETVTVGAGGAGGANTVNGKNGATTTFGSLVSAYGGGGGDRQAGDANSGAGGGSLESGNAGGQPNGAASVSGNNNGGDALGEWGGGAGGGGADGGAGTGGWAVYGGAGGGGMSDDANISAAGGTSLFGGDGGAGAEAGVGATGTVPGGGGGGGIKAGGTGGGPGGDGQVIVWEFY